MVRKPPSHPVQGIGGSPATRPSLIGRLQKPGDESRWQEDWREFHDLYRPLLAAQARREGLSEMHTGNASPWDVVRVDPTGTRCTLGMGNTRPGQKSLLSMGDWQLIRDVGNCRALGPAGSLFAPEGGEIIPLNPGGRSKKLFVATDGHSTSDTHIFSPDGSWFCWGTADGGVIFADLGEVERRLATIHNTEKTLPGKN